ncbi:hypothetical protein STCU_09975 [Strigomonas culicis]|uniref:Uncharacterized protein n=1 Tax=Strigomonas culicis TaxID=28005 RepID=S9UVA4_9TRYP|nr:hypothetical protein STCU_09975 [Strigomonas culicis]|eukprot:EPY18446.1 hypothetical protein STCU_09975 [Strigomonas culicis]
MSCSSFCVFVVREVESPGKIVGTLRYSLRSCWLRVPDSVEMMWQWCASRTLYCASSKEGKEMETIRHTPSRPTFPLPYEVRLVHM